LLGLFFRARKQTVSTPALPPGATASYKKKRKADGNGGMIRHVAIALFLGTCLQVSPSAAYAPGATGVQMPRSLPVIAALKGRPVILSDGQVLGRVASAWQAGAGVVTLQIAVDVTSGLAQDRVTLNMPGPIDPSLPIRLLVDREAFIHLVARTRD
jgi:hypothetical protein